MALDPSLNEKIIDVGRQVFGDLGDTDPSLLDPRYLNSLLMRWSMGQPEFKVNLFRLVDVLPTLTSNQAIAEHVREYLIPPANKIHPSLGWFISLCEHPLLANVAAFMVKRGVTQMASMFIAGDSPTAALPVLRRLRGERYSFTVDLLGEFCVCEKEASEYLNRYLDAIETFGATIPTWKEGRPIIEGHPGEISPVCISVKLSALYSQTNALNFERSVSVLSERLAEIARRVRFGALMYVDAEDSGNNAIIYEAFKRVFGSLEFIDIPYPGIVIQAYAKNSEARVDEMLAFARQRGSPIAIRLVKGAYWDFERTVSSQNDWEFPLWSKKQSSDAHYEHLSRKLLDNHTLCLPAFGSHNIRSLSHACCYAESIGLSKSDFEVQVLYGMAEPIARAFMKRGHLVRMYVPLGDLLPGMGYLVRRLLENTSNESFLRHTFFDEDEVSTLLREPHLQPEDNAIIPLTPPPPSITEVSSQPERANELP
jgi:RHH-type proline utilization regulon transcriptional repressor/proline dehydrogenase/delta 1-pyrroline-5-carboxylate dehydrogenase